ncbi:MAG: SCO family protein [Myxococcota bacterium]
MGTNDASGSKRGWLTGSLIVAAVVALGWYAGTRLGDSSGSESESGPAEEGEIYEDVAGQVLGVDAEQNTVKVHHERIEGFMESMVMDLQVADSVNLESIEPGYAIRFDLAHTGDTFEVIDIRPDEAAAGDDPRKLPDNPLDRGDRVPDLKLFDTQGNRFRLREMEAERKVITFFYVRCPLEDFCPAQSNRMRELQNELKQSGSDVHLVSLSLDSDHDDAEVLSEYAERFSVDPDRWSLAGGVDAGAVREFARRAGAGVERQDDSFQIDHALVGLRVEDDRMVDRVYGLQSIADMVRNM